MFSNSRTFPGHPCCSKTACARRVSPQQRIHHGGTIANCEALLRHRTHLVNGLGDQFLPDTRRADQQNICVMGATLRTISNTSIIAGLLPTIPWNSRSLRS
jgi:hypothetical protein